MFFKRESWGAGPTLDAAKGDATEAAKPLAAIGAVVVADSFSATDDVGVVPLAAWVVFGTNKLGAGADELVPGAEVVADVVVLLGFPRFANRDGA